MDVRQTYRGRTGARSPKAGFKFHYVWRALLERIPRTLTIREIEDDIEDLATGCTRCGMDVAGRIVESGGADGPHGYP